MFCMHVVCMFSACSLHLFSGVSELLPWADVKPCGLLQGLLHALPAVQVPPLQTRRVGEPTGAVVLWGGGAHGTGRRSAHAASKSTLFFRRHQCYDAPWGGGGHVGGRTGLHGGVSGGGEAVRTQAVAQQPCLAHGHHGVAGMQALVQKASLKENWRRRRTTIATIYIDERTVKRGVYNKTQH